MNAFILIVVIILAVLAGFVMWVRSLPAVGHETIKFRGSEVYQITPMEPLDYEELDENVPQ